jgi:manganese/zinc/iron transport system permease protein
MNPAGLFTHNTLVVALAVGAVGMAAGMVGALAVLRRRALAGDAAAHGTLAGVALAFLATGRRDLPWLLLGGLATALATLAALVLIRRWTRTRDDAATALVLGVSFGAGVALVTGITARGLPDSAGLEQFLLGHTAAMTARDALLLTACAAATVALLVLGLKEVTLVAFDDAFAAAAGWPVAWIDLLLVGLVAVMVVVGLPAAGAVLVTALLVIPPVAARQWTDRVPALVALSGAIGAGAALVGVVVSGLVPGLATGPVVVLACAAACAVSVVAAPERGWLARRRRDRAVHAAWEEGRILAHLAAGRTDAVAGGDAGILRQMILEGMVEPSDGGFRLTAVGRTRAAERARRLAAWESILAVAPDDARAFLTIDLPDPATVIDAARRAEIDRAAGLGMAP